MDRESLWLHDSHIACVAELPGNMSIVNRVSSKIVPIKSAIMAPKNQSFSNVLIQVCFPCLETNLAISEPHGCPKDVGHFPLTPVGNLKS